MKNNEWGLPLLIISLVPLGVSSVFIFGLQRANITIVATFGVGFILFMVALVLLYFNPKRKLRSIIIVLVLAVITILLDIAFCLTLFHSK